MLSSNHSPLSVDLKPLSPGEDMIFTVIGSSTLALAAFADCGKPFFKIQGTVVNWRNHNLPSTISKAVFPISENPNESVVEPVGTVIHHRHPSDYNSSLA